MTPAAVSGPARIRDAVRQSLDLIGPRSRRRYLIVVGAQMAASLLDLLGVLLIGATVVFAYSVPAGVPMPAIVQSALDALGLDTTSTTSLAIACAALAAVLLLCKSALSAFVVHRIFRFLARQQAQVSARLARGWFAGDLASIHRRPDLEVEVALTSSVYYATTGLLGSMAVVLGETSLLVVLSAALLVVDPIATVLTAACFLVVSVAVHRALSGWARRLGTEVVEGTVAGRGAIRRALESFRELSTARRLGFPVGDFTERTRTVAESQADLLYVTNVPKIAYEAALVVGAAILVGWRLMTDDVTAALAFLAVFLTAAARLLPSMVRLQGQLVMLNNSAGQAQLTYDVAAEEKGAGIRTTLDDLGRERPADPVAFVGFEPRIVLEHLTVSYPGGEGDVLTDVSLRVEPGESLVVVGVTGAGKSTLVDVVLGFVAHQEGRVSLGGLTPQAARERWPGAVAYMPQHSAVWAGSVRDNVALGLPREAVDDRAVWRALEQSLLASDVRGKGGLDADVGAAGRHLSGGQRQRLGIARALYSQPRMLVLDEATSALDEETEALIGGVLDELRGQVTVLAVAHRRATIERASRVAVIAGGRIEFVGSSAEYLQLPHGTGPTGQVVSAPRSPWHWR